MHEETRKRSSEDRELNEDNWQREQGQDATRTINKMAITRKANKEINKDATRTGK